jgi:CO/xanthine dehydrogenase FAD-binding subunit
MVDVNAGRLRPDAVVALRKVPELRGWRRVDGHVELGAGLTYTDLERPALAELVPALAQAARTVGSPQIRNAGTLGGNIATASPAGDTLPVLAAMDAVVTCASMLGVRELSLPELVTGPKRTTLRPGELIVSVRVPVLQGPQEFLKVGTRNSTGRPPGSPTHARTRRSARWSPTLPGRSTTTGPAPPTGGTPWRCAPGAR